MCCLCKDPVVFSFNSVPVGYKNIWFPHWPPCCCRSYACVGSCCPEWSHLSSRSSALHSGSPVPLHYSGPETDVGTVLTGVWSANCKNFTLLCFSKSNWVAHLFYKSVVGTIQVEFSQVVPVSKDQVGLLFYTQTPDRKHMLQGWIVHEQPAKCKTHTSVPYPKWTCRWWGHWGWVQSHPRRDSGSCRVCWCSAENMGRWLCTRLYPHTSSHRA